MKKIDFEAMASLNGGDNITAACTGLAIGNVALGIAALANWWNPVGWVGGAILLADVACIAYTAKH